jgi:hypothetical protein
LQVYNETKVRTGVVGYPVSEKGERGGSPSTVPAERHPHFAGASKKTELACYPERKVARPEVEGDCVGENK